MRSRRARARQVHEPGLRRHRDLSARGRRQRARATCSSSRQQGDRVVAILAGPRRAHRSIRLPATSRSCCATAAVTKACRATTSSSSSSSTSTACRFGRKEQATRSSSPCSRSPRPALLESALPADRAELEWRISYPISVLVLALLAVPLSRSAPREGRYARLGIGLLGYIVYCQHARRSRALWVERGVVPDGLACGGSTRSRPRSRCGCSRASRVSLRAAALVAAEARA